MGKEGSFLEWLQEEIDSVTEISEGDLVPAEEGEIVLYVANEEQQRLFTLAGNQGNLRNDLADKARAIGDDTPEAAAEKMQLLKEGGTARLRADMFRSMFWVSIGLSVDTGDASSLGLRSGFQVVGNPKVEECNCPACQANRAGLGLGGGITIIGIARG